MARLVSVNVGLPRDIAWKGETVHTGIWKESVEGRRMVRRLNVDGDGQGDLQGHGGEHRAVMVYQTESYRYWESQLGRNDFRPGQFGENFTVEDLPDDQVCIGDRYRIGDALFEVTQPRVTCYRVGIRMNVPDMAALLVSHHRPGFYFRVIEEGEVGGGDEITKVVDGPQRMTVAEVDALLYLPGHKREDLRRSLLIPALSSGWKGSFQALLAGDSVPAPAWTGFRSLRVARVDQECAGVISLSFESMDGSQLPAALPGQFLVIKVRIKPEAAPILRNYSISSAPGAREYRVSIKREVKGVASNFLHEFVKAGDEIELSAPRGAFTLSGGVEPVVLVSAGIGATPVLAMLHALAQTSDSREVWWIYGTRSRDAHPFADESRELLGKLARAKSHIAYSSPDAEDRLGRDYDSAGRLSVPLLDLLGVPRDADYYLCGPPAFLRDFTTGLGQRGTDSARIHAEIFGPGESMTPGIAATPRPAPHVPDGTPGVGPQVSFTRSGLAVPWNSSFKSLLELAEACDVPVKWSCRTGVCHTCESALIGGAVSYRPEPLEPPTGGNLLLCCAQPNGDVEIDL
jgi:ferredoxin-NADP reductase/MOSC domain-containing protein YiiM/ferredoxin